MNVAETVLVGAVFSVATTVWLPTDADAGTVNVHPVFAMFPPLVAAHVVSSVPLVVPTVPSQ